MSVWSLGLAFLLLATPKPPAAAGPHGPRHPAPPPRLRASAGVPPADLFSRRARRRAAILLRLRLEELRLAELERVRRAIEQRIPIDELLREDRTAAKR